LNKTQKLKQCKKKEENEEKESGRAARK